MDSDSGGQDVVDIPVQDLLRQTVVRDAVPQHTAQFRALLIHRHLVPHKGQIIGGGHAAWAAAMTATVFPVSAARSGGAAGAA